MYVKKDKIPNIWALLSNNEPTGPDIRKFESLGTRSFASEMAIGAAVDFHNAIGSARKQARLHFLQRYWTDKARNIKGVHIHTSQDVNYACAIALVSMDGLKPVELDAQLLGKYKIHAVGIDWENIKGVRVTPHIYTTPKDLDRLVHALSELSKTSK
jgi:selenocysteine lyase/cysteine desulfurase